MLFSYDNQITSHHFMTRQALVSVFGLLDPQGLGPKIDAPVLSQYTLDSFYVTEHTDRIVCTCKCLRSEPVEINKTDLDKIYRINGTYACNICLREWRTARTTAEKLIVWLRQNKFEIQKDKHLYLSNQIFRLYDPDKKQMDRPRRFVYKTYYGAELTSEDNILTKCGNPLCVNPLHLMAAASPATKITPEIIQDVSHWAQKKTPNKTIQELIELKYKKSISLRSLINIKNSLRVSTTTDSFCTC